MPVSEHTQQRGQRFCCRLQVLEEPLAQCWGGRKAPEEGLKGVAALCNIHGHLRATG